VRETAPPGNHISDCTPVSLAELLAPPFGGPATSVTQLHAVKTANDCRRPIHARRNTDDDSNYVLDDDEDFGTDI